MAEGWSQKPEAVCAFRLRVLRDLTAEQKKNRWELFIRAVFFDGKTYAEQIALRNVSRSWNRHFAVLSMFDMINRIIEEEKA